MYVVLESNVFSRAWLYVHGEDPMWPLPMMPMVCRKSDKTSSPDMFKPVHLVPPAEVLTPSQLFKPVHYVVHSLHLLFENYILVHSWRIIFINSATTSY